MHSHIFLYRAKYYRIMANSSQKSHLNRKIYVFRLITVIWMFPCSALLLCKAKNVLCFLHEWGLHPSYATDNGGKNGGNVGGTMVMSPALSPVLSQDEEKDASIDAKDATSSSKVATLDEKVASLEPKDTKVKKKA